MEVSAAKVSVIYQRDRSGGINMQAYDADGCLMGALRFAPEFWRDESDTAYWLYEAGNDARFFGGSPASVVLIDQGRVVLAQNVE